jgi:hypothetical protein
LTRARRPQHGTIQLPRLSTESLLSAFLSSATHEKHKMRGDEKSNLGNKNKIVIRMFNGVVLNFHLMLFGLQKSKCGFRVNYLI